ncbi:hypothetical protein AVEN_84440-1 [Araneus ventricosus]|uniref:Uncharacterized protein n=1 Tax=Araneus ventricosus TaxID=182803 RepID=A0A4Y2R1C6_ARAVE|nr:hypothetical protein AVEN_84440-1 [Araneus ventricosus]
MPCRRYGKDWGNLADDERFIVALVEPDCAYCPAYDANLTKNVEAAGESSVCSLVHKDKVRYPSTTKLSDTTWKGTTVPTNYLVLVYIIYGNRYHYP